MIWISLLHRSLFLGVSSRRHIFTASFSFVSYKTDKTLNLCYVDVLFLNDCVLFCGVARATQTQTSVIGPISQTYCSNRRAAVLETHPVLVEVNMGKTAHSQPLFQLPVPAVLVLPEGRFLHRWNCLEIHKYMNSFSKTRLVNTGMWLSSATRLVTLRSQFIATTM